MQATLTQPKQPLSSLALPVAGIVWAIAFGAGVVGVFLRLTTGHELANYGSYVPWGLWVAAYVYFSGLSAGAFLISTLVYVGRVRRLEPVAKLGLLTALITLLMGLMMIWFDLGHGERAWEVFVYGNRASMMAWMIWLYTAYMLVLIAANWFAFRADLAEIARGRSLRARAATLLTLGRTGTGDLARERDARTLRVLAIIGIPVVIAFNGGSGALFGVLAARPFWNASIFPIASIVGALASGTALLAFISAFTSPQRNAASHGDLMWFMGRLVLGLTAVYLLLEFAEFSIGIYGDVPTETEPYMEILTGPYWWVFWFVHVGVGAALPLCLLLTRPRSVPLIGAAGGLVAATFIAVRLNIVIPGLVVPQLEGIDEAFVDGRLTFEYFPSTMEWLVLLFVVSAGVAMFYAGSKLLPLTGT
ncbi:MAG: polysulfide reductase NrfD, partial [Chloroflexi bacterium]|nr:polysulfide reductase NrfD [Chloroflexota bacterium]